MLESLIIISILLVIALVAIRNLLVKVEKYEDVVLDQTKYLQNISNIITESNRHLKDLDEKGIFQGSFLLWTQRLLQSALLSYATPQNIQPRIFDGT